jgi:hypothetical protein
MTFDGPVQLIGAITAFRGEHFPLSNFYPHAITLDGHRYPTVEHCYQARKAITAADHDRIRDAGTPAEAKHLGHMVDCIPDWSERKVEVMRRALAAKFTLDSDPGAFLLATGTAPLVEGNDWDDTSGASATATAPTPSACCSPNDAASCSTSAGRSNDQQAGPGRSRPEPPGDLHRAAGRVPGVLRRHRPAAGAGAAPPGSQRTVTWPPHADPAPA